MERPRLFIVEDEAIVANDIKETLISLEYDVAGIAKSGELALEKIRETRPDLVLMDIHLAGEMDGVETAGQVHVLYDIPVIYLTAYADRILLDRAKVTEPYGYVIKPFDERELHSVIEMALYKNRIEREIKKRDAILFALSSAVEWLLRVSSEDRPEPDPATVLSVSAMRNILEPLGLALNAGAIVIFRAATGPSGQITSSIVYEWGSPAYHSSLAKPELKGFSFATLGLHRWEDLLRRGEVVAAAPGTLPDEEKPILRLLGVESGVVVPVFVRESFWGFIGFFDLTATNRSPDEIEALRITANLLGAAMGYR